MTDYATTTAHELEALEDERYQAVLNEDFDSFAKLCHEKLLYSHSNGDRDTLASYLAKCAQGTYRYHRIDHPVTEIIVVGDVALVIGEMHAELDIRDRPATLDNTSLAVWVREGESWKFLAYQATPKQQK
ncbi:nuclear transport factor 2 family protein [Arthrobacter sp. GCM10027362]|uniref:nuclear transport factor 2 family protein n=1 Tax=Arthrobacter sp. GCM10027362 TaxID=3273379 RepID=UPI00366E98A6